MNNKFNIKKLVKISAVALAMVSVGGVAWTINTNTNVHAESVEQRENDSDLESAKEDNIQAERDEDYAAYHAAKSDPSILAYDLTHARDRIKGHEQELIHDLTPSQRATVKKDMAEDDGAPDPAAVKLDKYLSKVYRENLFGTTTHSSNGNNKSVTSRPAHLSKAMVRKIMKQIRADKAIIRDDKKQLSSRKVRKAYKKYKKTGKKTFYARRYITFHKDKAEYEKKLTRLTKYVRSFKATKGHTHKSFKRVRKNHKHMKRVHKATRHHHKIRK